MRVEILCEEGHPINAYLKDFKKSRCDVDINIVSSLDDLTAGNILFLISCHQLVPADLASRYDSALVIHASDLPNGRGWSPHVWQVIEGKKQLVITVLEASPRIDEGDILMQAKVDIPSHALWDEINSILFSSEIMLIESVMEQYPILKFSCQKVSRASNKKYPRRYPKDSEIDINKTIREQFNLLRVSDPNRYPAFFYINGQKYVLELRKAND
jgi:methionyl-tRNA formyltransferase